MSLAKPLYIFGAGSLARLACHYAKEAGGAEVKGFIVDQQAGQKHFCGLPVLTWADFLKTHNAADTSLFVAIGYKSMLKRAEVFTRVRTEGFETVNILAPMSYVAKDSAMGTNNIVMPGTVLEPGVRIGDNNVFWSNTTICHDTIIGDHCFFASNTTIGGEAHIGSRNFFGFTSTVLHHCQVGDDNLIAAHALITKDLGSNGHYIGAPAKKTKDIDLAKGVAVD